MCVGVAAAISVGAMPGRESRDQLNVRLSRVTGRASFVTAKSGGPIAVTLPPWRGQVEPLDFLREYGHLFGISVPASQLALVRTSADGMGHTHSTYQQMHNGVPVFAGVIKVHQDAFGLVVAANGDFFPIKPTFDTVPRVTADEAVARALVELDTGGPTVERAELLIVDPGWYGDPPLGAHLAYHVILSDVSIPLREAFFVDARTGVILDRWTMIYRGRMRSIHNAEGGSDCCYAHATPGCDDSFCEAAVCDRRPSCCDTEWTATCGARAAAYCRPLCIPGPLARAEGDPPTDISDVDAAYDYYGDTYDYYSRAFGRDGIDDLGMPMVATVNSPAPGCPNAYWSGSLQQMVFCPGTATDDIVGHELTHGVIDYTADLIYQNQAGQLNESFSDVFGELIDLFNGDAAFAGVSGGEPWPPHPTGPGQDTPNNLRTACSYAESGYADGVRWLVGEDATVFGGAIRDMWDPTCFGDPDFANSPLQTCDIIDSGGVHSGSGIPNHAFALLTDGGTFNGFAVSGVGPIKAGAVWYRALATYLTIASDFEEAYAAFNQAALDLIGTFPSDPRTGLPSNDVFTAADAVEVDQALQAVEMNTLGRCGWTVNLLNSDPPYQCAAGTVLFNDEFESGVNGWTVSNTGPFGPPTPYDWVQTTEPLPFDRPGVAWYCEDRNVGDCRDQDESARHSLFSPPITMPAEADFPFLAFTHYMASEPGWDGGNLSVRVNGGEWLVVPGTAFEFNPYNSVMRGTFYSNTNPLAGQGAWTGVGGEWGTSIVDLRGLVAGGDTLEVRFDFGKDGCTGYGGWFLDDFTVYTCPDCNLNGKPDHQEFVFTAVSWLLAPIGDGYPQSFTLASPPPAASDVTFYFTAIADLSQQAEFITVDLNGTVLGRVFEVGGSDCPSTPNAETIVVPASVFNAATGGADAVINMTAAAEVSPTLCGEGTFITVFVQYTSNPMDTNGNGIPDECENCAVPATPSEEPSATAKIRYISFVPGSPGRHTALRVTFIDLPEPFEAHEGAQMWVDVPLRVSESPGSSGTDPGGFMAARLTCEPHFLDWGNLGVVHLFDDEIVPNAEYEVQAVDLACGPPVEGNYSTPLALATSRWGDVAGNCAVAPCTPPDGDSDMDDIAALVDKFRSVLGAPVKARADIAPDIPNRIIDFVDISRAVDAFRGDPYPFDGPEGCP